LEDERLFFNNRMLNCGGRIMDIKTKGLFCILAILVCVSIVSSSRVQVQAED